MDRLRPLLERLGTVMRALANILAVVALKIGKILSFARFFELRTSLPVTRWADSLVSLKRSPDISMYYYTADGSRFYFNVARKLKIGGLAIPVARVEGALSGGYDTEMTEVQGIAKLGIPAEIVVLIAALLTGVAFAGLSLTTPVVTILCIALLVAFYVVVFLQLRDRDRLAQMVMETYQQAKP